MEFYVLIWYLWNLLVFCTCDSAIQTQSNG